jgi:hypothetical protein
MKSSANQIGDLSFVLYRGRKDLPEITVDAAISMPLFRISERYFLKPDFIDKFRLSNMKMSADNIRRDGIVCANFQ